MPYISNKLTRERLDPIHSSVTSGNGLLPRSVGDLNFCITRLCDNYLNRSGVRYENINAVIGALECAKLEFYRRVAAPYEDTKLEQNGDVYESRQK